MNFFGAQDIIKPKGSLWKNSIFFVKFKLVNTLNKTFLKQI
jgi:hypothetical protein